MAIENERDKEPVTPWIALVFIWLVIGGTIAAVTWLTEMAPGDTGFLVVVGLIAGCYVTNKVSGWE